MNRKLTIILSISALILVSLIAHFLEGGRSYDRLVISEEESVAITGARTEAHLDAGLIFDGQKLIYDKSADTYYYSLPQNADMAFNPTVNVNQEGPGKVKAAFVEGGINGESIKSDKSIKILFYTDKSYSFSSLKCTTLPLMNIDLSGEIGDEFSQMKLSLYDNRKGVSKRSFESLGKIRKRGGITSEYEKFPLRIKLQHISSSGSLKPMEASLLGMPKRSGWILYPAYNDEDRVRNVFSQNLWDKTCSRNNAFGVPTGVSYRYLEVFIGGNYSGLYALGYTLEEEDFGITAQDEDQGLFKKVLDTRYDLLEMRDDPQEAIKGYRIITDDEERLEMSAKWKALAHHFIYLNMFADESDMLLKGIDLDNSIDFALFTDLVQGDDSIYKNFYLAIKKDETGAAHTLYCPWDLDATWGNEYFENATNRYAQYSHGPEYNFFMEDTYLEQILVNGDTDTLDKYIARYRELRSGDWSDAAIEEILSGYEDEIFGSGAYLRERERWPKSNLMQGSDCNLSRFKTYVLQRFAEFDAYFDRLSEVKAESTLIRRSAAIKDFDESDIVMEIKDREILNEEEYIEFLESLGFVDLSKITEDVRFIVYLRDRDETRYITDFGDVGDTWSDGIVNLAINIDPNGDYFFFFNDQDYTLFLNDVNCYDSSHAINERLVVSAVHDGHGTKMNTSTGYNLEVSDSVYEFISPEELYYMP